MILINSLLVQLHQVYRTLDQQNNYPGLDRIWFPFVTDRTGSINPLIKLVIAHDVNQRSKLEIAELFLGGFA